MDRSGEREATKDHQTVITCSENNARTAAIEAQADQEYDYKLFKREINMGRVRFVLRVGLLLNGPSSL